MTVAAVILAAGDGRRFGSPKALMPVEGRPAAARLLDLAAEAGLAPRVAVLGEAWEEILEGCPSLRPAFVTNPFPALGPLVSLRLGLAALPDDVRAALILPVDHPFVRSSTLAALAAAFEANGAGVSIPVFEGHRGHPVCFSRRVFPALFEAPLDVGARAVVRAHPEWVTEVRVADPGIHANVNTREELECWRTRLEP